MHQLSPATPEQAFAEQLAADPGRPFVTYYDEASGERTELSVRSLANWVAKTHYLLIDELGLGVGDGVLIALPAHWISVPALLGCWTAGLSVVADPGAAAVAFVSPATADQAAGIPDVYAVAPDSAAVGLRGDIPAGLSDYVTAVRPQPDSWSAVRFAAGAEDELVDGRSRGECVSRARARAAELGVAEGARVMSTRDWATAGDWLDTLLVPLVQGGSVVYVRNADDEVVARRAEQERVTVRI